MPGMSGFELLSVVRRVHPTIHVVATSGAFAGRSVPTGIAADAFYEKATSLSFLLEIIKAPPPEKIVLSRSSSGRTPIWICPSDELDSQEAYVLIVCSHCLRAFAKVTALEDELICKTECLHCQTVIAYAIVASGDCTSA
jgi:hypothetical protein